MKTSIFSQQNDTFSSKKVCGVHEKISSNGFYSGQQYWSLQYSLPRLLLQQILFTIILFIFRLILRPLRQPMIVSQIMTGIIMGPTVLGSFELFDRLMFPVPSLILSSLLRSLGGIYFFFLEGLKHDGQVVKLAGKKELMIAFSGIFCSFLVCASFILTINGFLPENIRANGALFIITIDLSLSLVCSIHPILVELNLLNTEPGRLSMSLSMLTTTFSLATLIPLQSIRIGQSVGAISGMYTFTLNCLLYVFMFTVARRALLWIMRRTPNQGGKADSSVVITILVLVLALAIVSNTIGSTTILAPTVFALLIPAGQPLGSALIQKIDTFLHFFLIPHVFLLNGRLLSFFDTQFWLSSQTWLMLLAVFFASLGKILGIFFGAKYHEIPTREAVTVALIMCFRGIKELFIITNLLFSGMIDSSLFASLVVGVILVNAIATPLVRRLARGSTMVTTCKVGRSMELESKRSSELHLMMCIHDEDNVPTLLNLLNASNGTKASPIHLCILHLIEFAGRMAPILFPYESATADTLYHSKVDHIMRAFDNLVKRIGGNVLLKPFISITPYKTMHLDICTLARDQKVCLVIVPLHKQTISAPDCTSQLVAKNMVLQEAPCSVGVLLDRRNLKRPVPAVWTAETVGFSFRIGTVFLGGADDRETLCYVSRMVENPGVSLFVLRCNAPYCTEAIHRGETLLDDKSIEEFRVKTEQRDNVLYREVSVSNVEEMLNSIRSMGTDFDLIIVGRQHPAHFFILSALSYWSEYIELGVVGDLFASSDFAIDGASVLSIQKYI